MIIVLEGADGTGKTTLANYIARELNGMVLHCIYNPNIDMEKYHTDVLNTSRLFSNNGVPTIIDRWSLSEIIYGNTFRNGPTYDADKLLHQDDIIYVYCCNENAVINHENNVKRRKELYSDMTKIVEGFDKYIRESDIAWNIYDFNSQTKESFTKEILR